MAEPGDTLPARFEENLAEATWRTQAHPKTWQCTDMCSLPCRYWELASIYHGRGRRGSRFHRQASNLIVGVRIPYGETDIAVSRQGQRCHMGQAGQALAHAQRAALKLDLPDRTVET